MNKKFSFAQFVDDFLKQLLEEAGFGSDPTELKTQMLVDLNNRLMERFFSRIIVSLPNEDQVTEFRKILESDSSESEVERFIIENFENPLEFFSQVMLEFRKDYLGLD